MESNKTLRETFLSNLDRIREKQEKSLPEISEELGHHRSYLGKVYRENMSITLELVDNIATVLGVPPEKLLSASVDE